MKGNKKRDKNAEEMTGRLLGVLFGRVWDGLTPSARRRYASKAAEWVRANSTRSAIEAGVRLGEWLLAQDSKRRKRGRR